MKRRKGNRKKKQGGSTILRIAASVPLPRTLAVVFCLAVAGVVEGIGIASLVPILALTEGAGTGEVSSLGRMVISGLDYVGLPATPQVLVGLLIFGMVGKAALMILAMREVARAVAEVGTSMRLRLLQALLDARWGFFTREPLGRFANALGNEAYRAGDAFAAVAQFAAHAIHAVIYIGLAALISWQLAALAIVAGLIMVLSLQRLITITKHNARLQTRRMKDMVTRLADVLIGLKPVKAMSRHAQFARLVTNDIRAIERAMRRHMTAKGANRALQDPIIAFLVVGGYFALTTNTIPLAELLAMGVVLIKSINVIGKAQQDLQAIRGTEASFWFVENAIEDAQRARESEHPGVAPSFERGVVMRNVSLSFAKNDVLVAANCVIEAGKVTSITGRSGAGKTTLVDIILGLHEPDSGEVLIDGVSLAEIDTKLWRGMIGYVPQELILFHDTIAMNVGLGDPVYTREDIEQALRLAGAWPFVAALPDGIDHIVGERGALLSGGQRQRIALARALVHKPKLLVLDEATSALDPQTEATIVENVCQISRETGLTVLAITHQPAWVRLADSVIEIEAGNVSQKPGPTLRPTVVAPRALAE
ncbi:MAG: ABC transporter ATP-binding protein [Reyranellaceae bacterium]